jgi:hypothetical protein
MPDQKWAFGLGDEAHDALAGLDADAAHHVLRESEGSRDHKVGRVIFAQEKGRALAADKLCGDPKYRVEQILCSSMAVTIHLSPILCPPVLRSKEWLLVRCVVGSLLLG